MSVLAGLCIAAHWIVEGACLLLVATIAYWIVKEHAAKARSWLQRRRDVRTARTFPPPDLHTAYVAQAKAAQAERHVREHVNPNDCRCDHCLLVLNYLKVIADRADWDSALVNELGGAA